MKVDHELKKKSKINSCVNKSNISMRKFLNVYKIYFDVREIFLNLTKGENIKKKMDKFECIKFKKIFH